MRWIIFTLFLVVCLCLIFETPEDEADDQECFDTSFWPWHWLVGYGQGVTVLCSNGNCCYSRNQGFKTTLDSSYGIRKENTGHLNNNYGTLTQNTGSVSNNYGLITANYGTVSVNYGNIIYNYGRVSKSYGTVKYDYGVVN